MKKKRRLLFLPDRIKFNDVTEILPFLLAVVVGFRHAFETDHLVAVSNIVTRRNSTFSAMKDGTFWGLGHTSSILIVGTIILCLKYAIPARYFQSLEVAVGIMIVTLGLFRLWQFFRQISRHIHPHRHTRNEGMPGHLHRVSFGIGIVHGLAGSGVLIAAATAAMQTIGASLLFLIIFSIGCIAGMMVAAAVLGLPFSKKFASFARIQKALVIISCSICVILGIRIICENWPGQAV